eukprot:TRINITY_DN18484_c0_g1_i1.p1 TRINITY_DN18484_c0_g1~~TRINITY_DN18484_c0_g1_i1.p1  ORF type:complete len:221 (+),score=27.66 TRINITY_DN18484_c0_g1_i1:466-1128(+)
MDTLLDKLAAVIGLSSALLRDHLLERQRQELNEERKHEGGDERKEAADGLKFHVLGALYVAFCPSSYGTLPFPLYLTHARSSCGIYPGAHTRVCSYLSIAQESGALHRSHRAAALSSVPILEVSAISRLPIFVNDCVAAVRSNAAVCAKTLVGDTFDVDTPVRCEFCTSSGEEHTLSAPSKNSGVIACSWGFCPMDGDVAKCSSCKQWFLETVATSTSSC